MDAFFKSEGFDTIGFEESAGGRKYAEDVYVSSHVDDCLIVCKSKDIMAAFRKIGYAERVLKTFGMWDCKPCATPLDANSRLSKADCPQVVDPALHRRDRSITGCLSYLARSRVRIFSVQQVCAISGSGTSSGC